jgi:tetratricopeptide (TPR) repeat protein
VDHLETAVTLDPKISAAHENLGAALAQTGHLSEAIEQFQAALEIDPSYTTARDNLGLAFAQTGQVPEAIEQFQKALDADPNDAKARQSLDKLQQYELQQNASGKSGVP